MIKLISFDLDFTLLNNHQKISDYTVKILTKAHDLGIKIIPCSSRIIQDLPEFLFEQPWADYFVSANGALVINKHKDILWDHKLPKEDVKKILAINPPVASMISIITANGVYNLNGFEVKLRDQGFPEEAINHLMHNRIIVSSFEELFKQSLDIYKVSINYAKASQQKQGLPYYQQLQHVAVTSSYPLNIEITANKVSKGQALSEIMTKENITWSEVISFGDQFNDYSMLSKAGIGAVMLNGDKDLQQKVGLITDYDNEHDGVARYIAKTLAIV